MSDEDITRIKIGSLSVGIVGLMPVIQAVARERKGKSEDEIRVELMEQLSKRNYIPETAMDAYEKALFRAFNDFIGKPCEKAVSEGLVVKVFGPGCSQCDQLEKTVMEVLSELQLPADLEHVRDAKEIASYGVIGVPALWINGEVYSSGIVPTRQKIKQWLGEAQ